VRLFGWVFGLLFLAGGVGGLAKSLYVLGLAYLAMGAVIFPPVRRWFQRSGRPLSMTATLWILMASIIVIAFSVLNADDPAALLK